MEKLRRTKQAQEQQCQKVKIAPDTDLFLVEGKV